MQRFAKYIAAATLGLAFGGLSAASAAASDPPVQLALGDSWARGARATPPSEAYVPQLNAALKIDFNCQAASAAGSAPDWSDQATGVHPGCPDLELVNNSVGGATTPSLIATQLPAAEALLEARNGNNDPRDDVEVTTLHIGGNDVNNPIIGACLPVFSATGVLSTSCLSTINSVFTAYRTNLTTVLSGLRDAAGDRDSRIVIGTYDNPIFSPCFLAAIPRARQLAEIALEGDPANPPQVVEGLHDIMREVAANYDVEVAEVFGDLNGPQYWASGEGFPQDCLHPNNLGYDQVTSAFLDVLLAR